MDGSIFTSRTNGFWKALGFGLGLYFCLGPLQASKVSETKDFIPQVLTFAELKKLSPENRALYLETLKEALQEIEELHQKRTKDPKKSKSTSAHNNSPHFPFRDAAPFLSLLANPAWANLETASSAGLTCPDGYDRGQDTFGDLRCFRKERSDNRRRPECRSNEKSAGIVWNPEQQGWERTCWVDPIKRPHPPAADGPSSGTPPPERISPPPGSLPRGNVTEADCRAAGGTFENGYCKCGEQYTFRSNPPSCSRDKGTAGCSPGESEDGNYCVRRPPGHSTPEQCIPRQCTVNREVQNEYSQRFRQRPEGGVSRRCINAGMVTDYDHNNPHCPRVPRAELGGFTTEDCPPRHTICNPLIFGLLEGNKPLCVPVGWATTRRCDQESRNQNARDIFTNRPSNLTEEALRREWDRFRNEFKSLCAEDETSLNFHCVECGVIARRNAEFLNQMENQAGGSSVKRTSLCRSAREHTPSNPLSPRAVR